MFGRKDTNIFTEIGKFFRNNDSNTAMNAISGVLGSLNVTEKDLFGNVSRFNRKYTI